MSRNYSNPVLATKENENQKFSTVPTSGLMEYLWKKKL